VGEFAPNFWGKWFCGLSAIGIVRADTAFVRIDNCLGNWYANVHTEHESFAAAAGEFFKQRTRSFKVLTVAITGIPTNGLWGRVLSPCLTTFSS
jgi:hypothetical protein